MKKILLSTFCVLFAGIAMAQNQIELTFSKTDAKNATVTVAPNENNITSTISSNYDWKTLSANSEAFPTASILCPDKNTKDMTSGSEGTITITLSNVPENYRFSTFTFTSVALNGGGAFQADDANAQHVDFTLSNGETEIGTVTNQKIKVNSNGGQTVVITFTPASPIAAENGELSLTLKITNNYTARGCFYGLTKVALAFTEEEESETPVVPEEEKLLYHLTGESYTASQLMEATQPVRIAIKCLAANNHFYWNYKANSATSSVETYNQTAVFIWEPVTEGEAGSYYLKKAGEGYMQNDNPGNYAESTENAAVFTAVNPEKVSSASNKEQFTEDSGSSAYVSAAGYDNVVRFVTTIDETEKWLNIGALNVNTAGDTQPRYMNGYGTYTIYQICKLKGFDENVNVTIKNTGDDDYATFYYDAPVSMPEGVTAYTINSVSNTSATLTEVPNNIVPANTGVILKANVDADKEISLTVNDAQVAAIAGNKLAGSIEEETITKAENKEYYVLWNDTENPGLYIAGDGGDNTTFTNRANKAYLVVEKNTNGASLSNSLRFDFGGTTAIAEVETENENEDVIYDLQGRRVNEITEAGIYIVNGNKVLIK